MHVEDHPFEYGTFEGVIPDGYGAGIVMLWDQGTWTPETDDVDGNARGKLAAKRVDLIAANRVGVSGSGFESDDNTLLVHDAAGHVQLGPASKAEIADRLVALVAARLVQEPR